MRVFRFVGILLSGVCSLRVLAVAKLRALFSSIGGRSINFPTSLLELQSGRHRITADRTHELADISIDSSPITVESIDEGAAVADVVAVPQVSIELLPSGHTTVESNWPLQQLLAEVVASSVISKAKPAFRGVDTAARKALLAKGLQLFDRTNAGEIVDWVTTEGETLAQLPRSIVHKYNILHRGIGCLILDSKGRVFVHQRSATKRLFPSMYDMFIGGVSAAGESSMVTLLRELSEEVGLDFTAAGGPVVGVDAAAGDASTSTSSSASGSDISAGGGAGSSSGRSERSERSDSDNKRAAVAGTAGNVSPDPVTKFARGSKILQPADGAVSAESSTLRGSYIRYLGRTTIQTSYNHCLVDCYVAVCGPGMESSVKFSDGEVQWGEWITGEELDRMLLSREPEFVPDGMQVWRALPEMMRTKNLRVTTAPREWIK